MPATFANATDLRYAAIPTSTADGLVAGTSGGSGSGFSLSCWYRQTAFGDAAGGAIVFELANTAGAAFVLKFHVGVAGAGFLRFETNNATTTLRKDLTYSSLANHRWTHFAVTWDGGLLSSGVKVYADGVEVTVDSGGTRNGVGAVASPTASVAVGGSIINTNRDHVGMLHKVAAWNTVLTLAEVQQLAGLGSRAYNPSEIQPSSRFVDAAFDANTDNNCNATTGTPGAKTGGTPTLTNRVPGDIPGVGFWFKPGAAGNTLSSGRITTAIDYAGSTLTATQGTLANAPHYATLGGPGDRYAAPDSGVDLYLDSSAASGPAFDARYSSILSFASPFTTQAHVSRQFPRIIMSLGNPATTNGGKAELWLSLDGFPVGGEASSTARTTGTVKRADAANPRLLAAVFSATGVNVYADDDVTTNSTPATAATGTGFRLFGALGATITNKFDGHVYDTLFYQRPLHADEIETIRAAFRDEDATAGISTSYFSEAVGLIATVGSSSMYGTGASNYAGLLKLVQPSLADRIIYNFARPSGTRAHIQTFVDTYAQAADVLALFPKANRHAIIQPFGNDNDGSGTFGYGGSTTFASALADIQATVTDLLTDYAKVGHWETIPRGSIGTDTEATLATRERDRWALIAGLTGVYRFNFDTITELDPRQPGLTDPEDDNEVFTAVDTLTSNGAYFNADQIHLNDGGFALLATQFNLRIGGLLSSGRGTSRWGEGRSRRCERRRA
jgi:hypothetical protein